VCGASSVVEVRRETPPFERRPGRSPTADCSHRGTYRGRRDSDVVLERDFDFDLDRSSAGSAATPMAERLWRPASPKTSASNGCAVDDGGLLREALHARRTRAP
jgi:hypothetical protein